MEGLVFGLIDNGIMLLGAMFGLNMERLMPGCKRGAGALVGAGLGNALSDFVAGLGEGGIRFAFGTLVGCLAVMVFIPLVSLKKRNE